ncbi:MAG: hypothetical protein KGN38_07830, partial [Actinomycetales bacterium]|nr:hypothetical protein [Actinomycetales bacterium]
GTFDASDFTWSAEITGNVDGTLRYAMRGSTDKPFLRNRLGLCVLDPMDGFAGRECTITAPDGSTAALAFPDAISPHQPFRDIRAMEYPGTPGTRVRVAFDGDVFETEDHRNWSDASYKTYCTPISLPFPVEVQPGDEIAQSVTVSVDGEAPDVVVAPEFVTIDVAEATVPLPAIGTQATDLPWTDDEIAAVRALSLDHLMVTVTDEADPVETLRQAAGIARATGTRLRVRFTEIDDYASLRDAVREIAPLVDSWMVIRADEKVTSAASLAAARDVLGDDLPWTAGTDRYFTEVNRMPPDTTDVAWLSFTLNPQVHAADDRSILQNTASQEVIARNAPRLAGDARIAVGPISLRPRYNPNATDPTSDPSNTPLPSSVDARQRTWLGAAWTALSLRGLAQAGTIDAVTYYEALGWRGLRERDAGSADPAAFPSRPGEEFPVYALLRDLVGHDRVHPTRSDQPEVADALVVTGAGRTRAVVVNLSPHRRTVVLTGAVSATIEADPSTLSVIDLPGRPA